MKASLGFYRTAHAAMLRALRNGRRDAVDEMAAPVIARRRYNRHESGEAPPLPEHMSNAAARKARPKYLNILELGLAQPVPAVLSILHRISGALLFFPGALWLLWLLDRSLASPEGFEAVKRYVALWPAKLALIGFLWLFCHHFFAGIRYLFLDIDKGVDRETARATSWMVFAAGALVALWLGAKLW